MALLELVTLVSPARCAGCRLPGSALCRACLQALGKPVVPTVPGVDQVVVGLPYRDAARSLVLDLKLNGDRSAAPPLARALIREVASVGLTADVVTSVPGRARPLSSAGTGR